MVPTVGNITYSNSYFKNLNKIQRLQNRAARIVTGDFDYVNTRGIHLEMEMDVCHATS